MSPPERSRDAWWRRALVYQVYIRSFADSDGDGIGDIGGIRSRLPYIRDLGADAVWITPWYPSPMADGGYDVADYRDIDPLFGTLEEADALVAEAHQLGLKIIVDLVPNHTSSAHRWFREAITRGAGSSARGRYIFRDGRGPDGDEPPNNWQSVFGGPAWTREDAAPFVEHDADGGWRPQWYLHLFDASQPDLNWDNPEVRAEFESILAFWIERAIDGFRIDVAHSLVKDPGLPDLPAERLAEDKTAAEHPHWDRDGVHEVYRGWRRILDATPGERVFCGEIDVPAERIARYLVPDELHTAFNFDFAHQPWRARELHSSIERTLRSHRAVGAPPTWILGNHDLPRPPFRLGRPAPPHGAPFVAWTRMVSSDQEVGLRRLRAATLLYLALPGSAYLYQGDELGLPEVLDLPPEVRQDPTWHRTNFTDIGRDGCRVPIPWSGTTAPFGFGPDGSMPWLPQPPSWADMSVEAEAADENSVLALVRRAIALRKASPALSTEVFRWLDAPADVLFFERGDDASGRLACAVNLSDRPFELPCDRQIILASVALDGGRLPPDAAAWLDG